MSNEEKIEEVIESTENKENQDEIINAESKTEENQDETINAESKTEENQDETINAESKTEEEIKFDDETFFKSDNVERKTEKTSNLNKIIIIVGYIFALLIPLIGLIYGIILAIINKPPSYREHGIYIILLSLIMWIVYFLTSFTVIP